MNCPTFANCQRGQWRLCAAFAVLLLIPSTTQAGVAAYPGLTAIRFTEVSGVPIPHTFLPASSQRTTQLGILNPGNNDFRGVPSEAYEGGNYVPGSELLAVDADTPVPSTFTVMGNTAGMNSRMRVTGGWKESLVPPPATASIVGIGLIASAAVQRRRRRLIFATLVKGKSLMNQQRQIVSFSLLVGLIAYAGLLAASAQADPLTGRDLLKFSQRPMDATSIVDPNGTKHLFWGHDELSTAYSLTTAAGATPYRGTFMADDFADKFSSPVVHVKWWGSYLHNLQNQDIPVNKFLISFESDQSVDAANPFSHPDKPLLNQIVKRVPVGGLTPGSGTFTEKSISDGGPPLSEKLYEYNAELHLGKEFFQKPDTVYWLKIVALVDLPLGTTIPNPNDPSTFIPQWGWHNRDYTLVDPLASTAPAVTPGERVVGSIGPSPGGTPIWHFQDDAVTGRIVVDHLSTPNGQIMPLIEQTGYKPTRYLPLADGPQLIGEFSKDLAFELYTIVPEPGTCLMFVCGSLGLAVARSRRIRG